MGDSKIFVEKAEVVLNKHVILLIFIVTGLSIVLAGCLAYLFSDSLFTMICGVIIGVTIGVMINYFLVVSYSIVRKIDIKLSTKDDVEEVYTIMKKK